MWNHHEYNILNQKILAIVEQLRFLTKVDYMVDVFQGSKRLTNPQICTCVCFAISSDFTYRAMSLCFSLVWKRPRTYFVHALCFLFNKESVCLDCDHIIFRRRYTILPSFLCVIWFI